MTIEEVKRYLKGYVEAKKKYQIERENLEVVETSILSITISWSEKVKSTPKTDKLADNIDKLNRVRQRCIDAQHEATATMEKIYNTISKIEDIDLKTLLYKKYIHDEIWEQIAVEMNFSYRWVLKLHGKALVEAKKVLENCS